MNKRYCRRDWTLNKRGIALAHRYYLRALKLSKKVHKKTLDSGFTPSLTVDQRAAWIVGMQEKRYPNKEIREFVKSGFIEDIVDDRTTWKMFEVVSKDGNLYTQVAASSKRIAIYKIAKKMITEHLKLKASDLAVREKFVDFVYVDLANINRSCVEL